MKTEQGQCPGGDRSVIRKLVLSRSAAMQFPIEQSLTKLLYLGVMVSRNMQGNYIERQRSLRINSFDGAGYPSSFPSTAMCYDRGRNNPAGFFRK